VTPDTTPEAESFVRKAESWAGLILLFVLIGIPLGLWHLLIRPRAYIAWIRQGGGYPSPVQLEQQINS